MSAIYEQAFIGFQFRSDSNSWFSTLFNEFESDGLIERLLTMGRSDHHYVSRRNLSRRSLGETLWSSLVLPLPAPSSWQSI